MQKIKSIFNQIDDLRSLQEGGRDGKLVTVYSKESLDWLESQFRLFYNKAFPNHCQ
jgi:hypothetical protein